ncbi:MAG TPA: alpha/beta hydrolase [Acidobacteriota bacterium]
MDQIDIATHSGLHYETHGSGRPVLFLHGFGAHLYTWKHLVEPLSKRNRILLADLKGHGQSPKPKDKKYSVYDQADLVHELICKENLSDLTIVGHSFGGAVALVVALRFIEEKELRLSKLALLDSAAFRQSLPRFVKMLRTTLINVISLNLLPYKFQIRTVLWETYFDSAKISEDFVESYAKILGMPGAKHALMETAKQIIPSDIDRLASEYRKIKLPTLIVWGGEDRTVPLEIGERLSQVLPNSEMVVIEKCGHVPQEEQPEELLKIISRFLARPSPGLFTNLRQKT